MSIHLPHPHLPDREGLLFDRDLAIAGLALGSIGVLWLAWAVQLILICLAVVSCLIWLTVTNGPAA